MFDQKVEKPADRSPLRKRLSKEYFILKRKMKWYASLTKYAGKLDSDHRLPHSYIKHFSLLLRELKDVEMALQRNKTTNLRLALERTNGILIRPGEVFSIWKLVGRPTKSRGFLDGLVLSNGKVGMGTGGGLCQLGNLIYWMALHTPLTVKERWRHSYDVFPDAMRRLPFGTGATLSYNYIDLQLQNNTSDTFQIKLWLDDTYLNGEILCSRENDFVYKIVETDHKMQQQWWGGYTRHNRISRIKTSKADQSETTELIAQNHAIMMYSPLIDKAVG